jgi:hypothetical protein
LPVTNTPPYLATASVTKKSFITLGLGVNVIKTFFSSSVTTRPNRLKCFSWKAFPTYSNVVELVQSVPEWSLFQVLHSMVVRLLTFLAGKS